MNIRIFKDVLRKWFYNDINDRENLSIKIITERKVKRMKSKKFITAVIAFTMLAASASSVTSCAANNTIAGNNSIKVLYNGEEVETDVSPKIINDRTYVPMRAIFEKFGAYVRWDGDTKTITAKKNSKTITMQIDSNTMTKNEETVEVDSAPTIVDDRTMVPVRAVSELLGLNVDWDGNDSEVIITSDEDDDSWKENTGTIDLDKMTVTGDGISVDKNVITITKGGDYTVTGECKDGMILINSEEKVKLRLNGMSLTNSSGPAIFFENADKGFITVENGTKNYLEDGESYSVDAKGVISSNDNLEIKGKGTLEITANYDRGISADDSLEISGGNINITAKNDGINVNDTAKITGGTVSITAEGDGMVSGEILAIGSDAKVNIVTTGDVSGSEDVSSKGLKADWLLQIDGGDINITSTDHAIHSADEIIINGGNIEIASGDKGISGHGNVTVSGGTVNITKSSEGIESKKILTVSGGDINVTASDDGFNAGGGGNAFGGFMGQNMPDMPQNGDEGDTVRVQRGGRRFGEDGQMPQMSEDGQMPPQMSGEGGQRPQMPQMNGEGGQMPQMNGEGDQRPQMPQMNGDGTRPEPPEMSEDGTMPRMGGRGMRGNMPSDGEGGDMTPPDMSQMPGMGMGRRGNSSEISTEHHIEISGGNIYINAGGDGVDSNGSIRITGGTVVVDGPVSNGNSALDCDGAILINGGSVIAIGSAGMIELPSTASEQNVISYTVSGNAGAKIEVKDSKGKVIMSHTAKKEFSNIIVSSADIETGETYTVSVDGSDEDITVSDAVTTAGAQTGGMFGGRGMREQTEK